MNAWNSGSDYFPRVWILRWLQFDRKSVGWFCSRSRFKLEFGLEPSDLILVVYILWSLKRYPSSSRSRGTRTRRLINRFNISIHLYLNATYLILIESHLIRFIEIPQGFRHALESQLVVQRCCTLVESTDSVKYFHRINCNKPSIFNWLIFLLRYAVGIFNLIKFLVIRTSVGRLCDRHGKHIYYC